MVTVKLCGHCSRLAGEAVYLPAASFAKDPSASTGLQSYCRLSHSEIVRKHLHPKRLPGRQHPDRVPAPNGAPQLDFTCDCLTLPPAPPKKRKGGRRKRASQMRSHGLRETFTAGESIAGWEFLHAARFCQP